MDQIEKLFVALSPATINLIKERIECYRDELNSIPDQGKSEMEDHDWCDQVIITANHVLQEKN